MSKEFWLIELCDGEIWPEAMEEMVLVVGIRWYKRLAGLTEMDEMMNGFC